MDFLEQLLAGGAAIGGGTVAVLSALASAVAVIVVAVRKRRDLDYNEMVKRIASLESRVEHLEGALDESRKTVDSEREQRVVTERKLWQTRSVLAQNGLADPTLEAS